ncbi:MAG: TylF/MycF/NovP-related O-methyltransferase [Cyanobacteriota bacterium]
MKKILSQLANQLGFEISRKNPKIEDPLDEVIFDSVSDFTMTSQQRILSVIDSIRYVSRNRIPGAIVECGVWRGGSSMAAALTLLQEKDVSRRLYLFDTYTGMTMPTDRDVSIDGSLAKDQFPRDQSSWCAADLEDVRRNMFSTGYPKEGIDFIVGPVEETIKPTSGPSDIALLRLDTDWYESTRHELVHLFPRISIGGVLIIDDYGHWQGARKAVDEYFSEHDLHYLLHRIDYSGRMLIKTKV